MGTTMQRDTKELGIPRRALTEAPRPRPWATGGPAPGSKRRGGRAGRYTERPHQSTRRLGISRGTDSMLGHDIAATLAHYVLTS